MRLFTWFKRYRRYVSPIDRFLAQFDRTTAVTDTQRFEIEKHAAIFRQRDEKL